MAMLANVPVPSDPSARPDLAAYRRAVTLPWSELVGAVVAMLGRKLTAYIAGVRDVRALDRWTSGTEPAAEEVVERIRLAFRLASALAERESPQVVQAWMTGLNPELGDRLAVRLLREGDLEIVGPQLLGAARAFLAGA
jgi:hypothetical protein